MYVDFVDFVSCDDSRYSGTCGGVVAQINRMLVVKSGLNTEGALVSRHPQYERMVPLTRARVRTVLKKSLIFRGSP